MLDASEKITMTSISKYFCDKCGIEDAHCVVAWIAVGYGYEVDFILCRDCKLRVFEEFVKGLKGWNRLEKDSKRIS